MTSSGVGQLFMLRSADNFVPRPGIGFSGEASIVCASSTQSSAVTRIVLLLRL